MATLQLNFSHSFPGLIWNTLADTGDQRLFLEVRDVERKTVSFSALNLRNNEWLWKDIVLDEPWWVSLAGLAGDRLLLTLYNDTNNPDRKSLLAYDIASKSMAWWYSGFSLLAANRLYVKGIDARFPGREMILGSSTGVPLQEVDFHLEDSQNFPVIRPFQYKEGTQHFATVGHFLRSRLEIVPVATLDYLETDDLIMVSAFVRGNDLANYLYVFDTGGALLLKDKLGEGLPGVGMDTFFVYADHLISVRNKRELITYRII